MRKNILDFSYEELVDEFSKIGLEKFRVDQVWDWIYKKHEFDFDKMTNLSKEHRNTLSERFYIYVPELLDMQISQIDKTTKFLWKLEDDNTIESVLLFHPDRVTACISTQVGCPAKCAFCATGQSGFVRNLSAGEIVSQIIAMEKHRKVNIGNIVYMGMGEPLLNYKEVVKSVKMLNHKKGKNISMRRISISTVGIPEKIVELAQDLPEVKLAISLHAPNNYKRDIIVPMNKKYSVEEIIQSAKEYQKITKNRVTFEYILIREFNDFVDDAEKLAELLKGMGAYVNLIPVNPVPSSGELKFERPHHWAIERFKEVLDKHNIENEIRREKGTDIDAACGQLRRRYITNKK
ncbi:23S rRNA (adenine(2503)-C(2))-methyltransferase RlmN [Fervidobacterium nodosum]|uniref:Probable dual-specificity RNA methyltransferase RlmN n=1 Tax=Fervidobacterium nodosum (strain ATCC 35602 / DSM 5306 / Rt17-B1) TaxID=381764 RepID=RLMN_FERNB|nr:23S rRNA (adenine(2503)-C(2))-methyltransferase RlmN [Fervidobacterium nodosum]A7HNQ1.1 RecName: Full=Probable dual-specificity RNA methyltransferase RlmN; AltName: Full=23S rRNA (adenine(2503)-C(2))-methyltransferase; AltName: Full=23S rRNA m2A2503 methyltransferase; AltName: Full=Ribosomal RNA large subunit methyltransferase N; AltName: Full=tRNA (adenine(37)-C(2))-methyltransferase; AltName: Full=tRNA m2A37 methyltransferase [Fervidobacterium nodosum Rt17-B1]ABS61534.1 radical SAM enzyme, C